MSDASPEPASVGRAFSDVGNLSVAHPLYQAISGQVEQRVAQHAAEKGAAKADAPVSFATVALGSEEYAQVVRMFPEFRIVHVPMHLPGHALFVQCRRSAVDWVFSQAVKMAKDSVACLGMPLMAALQSDVRVSLVAEPNDPVFAHERHVAGMDAYKIHADAPAISREIGRGFSRTPYEEYVQTGASRVGVVSRIASVSAQAICVDGMLHEYSPHQVAAALGVMGASVAYGVMPYHSSMLLNSEGVLEPFGVSYVRDAEHVRFVYPDGVAGVTHYSYDVWRSWLVSHSFCLGAGAGARWYQLELLKERGAMLFYRMVALSGRPAPAAVVHALDLHDARGKYLVTSMRLRGVVSDPNDRDSWRERRYLVDKRLVDRVYQFAMQLPREQFSRYALRKQIHAVNDRVTIEGTSVKVNPCLTNEVVDALVVDLYARAFVDRYESGELMKEVRQYVDEQSAFARFSRTERLWYVSTAAAVACWDFSMGALSSWARQAADAVRRWACPAQHVPAPVISIAPGYAVVDGQSLAVLDGGEVMAREVSRRAAVLSKGQLAGFVRSCALAVAPPATRAFRVQAFAAFATPAAVSAEADSAVEKLRGLVPLEEGSFARRQLEIVTAVRDAGAGRRCDFNPVADPVHVFNEFHSAAFPGVAEQNLEHDTASVSLDPQDRTLMAPYMRLPRYFGDAPVSRAYYPSRVKALNTPKRQQTLQELLSAVSARNLNAPQVSLPQDNAATAAAVWNVFLDKACVPEARVALAGFKRDPVGVEEEAFREWITQSTPQKLAAVRKELEEASRALEEMPVHEYLVQLKADFKPTLSTKPLSQRTEPQVIVYHEKALSALYSSMYRVLVRRFLSLLKPNYHVNLLKDNRDMEAFVRGVHPFGETGLRFLENDFGKYDKSQAEFVFVLEQLVFSELGMNADYLQRWVAGHVKCSLRALGLGLSLHVMYQRKSGDATTSFGNVLLNVLSVTYAYSATDVVWALFMGDDSLVCARTLSAEDQAVAVLAEVFNLGAKFYVTTAPYFASTFVLIDDVMRQVAFVPDPLKRVERWSASVSAVAPAWDERFVSAADSLGNYLDCAKTAGLVRSLAERYGVEPGVCGGVADAVATVVSDQVKFRAMWEDDPVVSLY